MFDDERRRALGVVVGVLFVAECLFIQDCELALGGGEIYDVGHIVLAAAVVDESVVLAVLRVVGVRFKEPLIVLGRGLIAVVCRDGVFRHLDDVGEQGVLDDAVHGGGDVVDLDIRKLFEDGVALAFMGAFVVGDGRGIFIVDHALGIAELFFEHIVGLAGLRIAHGREGVHIDIEGVAEHHAGERLRDVGDGGARKALESHGSVSVAHGAVVALDVLARVNGGVVEGEVAEIFLSVHHRFAAYGAVVRDKYVRAVVRLLVLAHHDFGGVSESDGVEGVAHLVDGGVLESLQDLRAVLVDVQHLAEFERGEGVRRARDGGDGLSRDDLRRGLCRAGVHAEIAREVVVQAGVVVEDRLGVEPVFGGGEQGDRAVLGGHGDEHIDAVKADLSVFHEGRIGEYARIEGGAVRVCIHGVEGEEAAVREHKAARAVAHIVVEEGLHRKDGVRAVVCGGVVGGVDDMAVVSFGVSFRVERGSVAGVVGLISPVVLHHIAHLAVDQPVLVRARYVRLGDILSVREGRGELARRHFDVVVRDDVEPHRVLFNKEVAVRVDDHAHGQVVHHLREGGEGCVAEGGDEVVFAERETEVALDGVDGHLLVVDGGEDVVEGDVHLFVKVVLQHAKVGIFRLEIHVEELAHVAQGHIVDDVAEMVGDFQQGIAEEGSDVDAADLRGDLQPVIGPELLDGELVHILQVADEGLHELEDGLVVDVALVVKDVGAEGVLDLPHADQRAGGEHRAHHGDHEEYHAHDHTDDKIQCFHSDLTELGPEDAGEECGYGIGVVQKSRELGRGEIILGGGGNVADRRDDGEDHPHEDEPDEEIKRGAEDLVHGFEPGHCRIAERSRDAAYDEEQDCDADDEHKEHDRRHAHARDGSDSRVRHGVAVLDAELVRDEARKSALDAEVAAAELRRAAFHHDVIFAVLAHGDGGVEGGAPVFGSGGEPVAYRGAQTAFGHGVLSEPGEQQRNTNDKDEHEEALRAL